MRYSVKKVFGAKYMGKAKKFLGMEFKTDQSTIRITQKEYIIKMLSDFNMSDDEGA